MLERIEAEEPRAVAMHYRAGGQHLGVDERLAREQPVEEPAMPVGPVHHRSDTKTPRHRFAYFMFFFNHLNGHELFHVAPFLAYFALLCRHRRNAAHSCNNYWMD
jgi:hypothetical protein